MVFGVKEESVENFVDGLVVLVLDALQERNYQTNILSVLHNLAKSGKINLIDQDLQKIVDSHWLLFKIEDNSSVVEIAIGGFVD